MFTEDDKPAAVNDHLLTSHKLVIGELQEVADLPKYAVFPYYCTT